MGQNSGEADVKQQLKKIGVFTSGGDAPGMNAAIRAVVRVGISSGLEVIGIVGGYQGMLDSAFEPLNLRSAANIIQRGGTVLKTGRSLEFHKAEVRAKAFANLKAAGIEGLVCIGGDGSFRGAHALFVEHKIPVIGVPGTIDNDIYGSDLTIGFDTAVNTALDAIDRIRDTAASHDRVFIVEVMGRESGFIALTAGLAGGAEIIFAPEYPLAWEGVLEKIKQGQQRGKKSSILVTAEGQKPGRAYDLAEQLRKRSGIEAKVSILGHQQRGGSPTASDRILASRLGAAATQLLMQGESDVMVGTEGDKVVKVPLEQATTLKKQPSKDLFTLVDLLAN